MEEPGRQAEPEFNPPGIHEAPDPSGPPMGSPPDVIA
jgi:hypothetical protein